MDIAVTGASGLIGSALTRSLRADGHRVRAVTRSAATGADTVHWDPAAGVLDPADLAGVDAVVHLAGAPIADKRWTEERKRELVASRVEGTGLVARTLATLDPAPSVFVCGSAIGVYGLRGDEVLTEASIPGDDFLADLVQKWEAAAFPAVDAGIRTAFVRTGLVMAKEGGILAIVLPLFKAFVGGKLGSGEQWMSWVTIDDEVGAIRHLIDTDGLAGPFNVVAPQPVTNAEFTAALGRAVGRPAVLPVPSFGPKLLFGGEKATSTIFASQRVSSDKLVASGYEFRHPDIDTGLRAVLGKGEA